MTQLHTAMQSLVERPANAEDISTLLGASLAPASDTRYMTSYQSDEGRLGELAVEHIELRIMKDDARRTLLTVRLAEPLSGGKAFVATHWPDADFTLANAGAPDAPSYWHTRQGDAVVKLGTDARGDTVRTLIVDRMDR